MVPDMEEMDEDTLRRLQRLAKKATYSIGCGLGLFILRNVLPPVEQKEQLLAVFTQMGWCMIVYGLMIILCMVFVRKLVFILNTVLTWFVLPTALIYVVTGTF